MCKLSFLSHTREDIIFTWLKLPYCCLWLGLETLSQKTRNLVPWNSPGSCKIRFDSVEKCLSPSTLHLRAKNIRIRTPAPHDRIFAMDSWHVHCRVVWLGFLFSIVMSSQAVEFTRCPVSWPRWESITRFELGCRCRRIVLATPPSNEFVIKHTDPIESASKQRRFLTSIQHSLVSTTAGRAAFSEPFCFFPGFPNFEKAKDTVVSKSPTAGGVNKTNITQNWDSSPALTKFFCSWRLLGWNWFYDCQKPVATWTQPSIWHRFVWDHAMMILTCGNGDSNQTLLLHFCCDPRNTTSYARTQKSQADSKLGENTETLQRRPDLHCCVKGKLEVHMPRTIGLPTMVRTLEQDMQPFLQFYPNGVELPLSEGTTHFSRLFWEVRTRGLRVTSAPHWNQHRIAAIGIQINNCQSWNCWSHGLESFLFQLGNDISVRGQMLALVY